jgi:hypothetical protein
MDTDFVLQIGWMIHDPERASAGLRILLEMARACRPLHISEADTKAIFVEPLVRGLGWDTLDIDQVNRESQRGRPVADLHLLGKDREGKRKLASAIEVKPLDSTDLGPAYSQLSRNVRERLFAGSDTYNQEVRLQLGGEPFVRGVVTSGACWSVYDFDPTVVSVPPEDHIEICHFELQGDERPSQLIQLLGRNHLLNRLGLSVT